MSQLHTTLLNALSASLFNTKNDLPLLSDSAPILKEANSQTVFPLVYSLLAKQYDLSVYLAQYYSVLSRNIKVTAEHKAIHKLLCENGYPYVILKGCASASFYPDPLLRTMGDVDVFVKPADFEKVRELLLKSGYEKDVHNDGIHISFTNPKTKTNIELHRRINGIPENDAGKKISTYFDDIFEKAVLVNDDFYRPSEFHHGLILLLHKISHLTKEGVGLRQFCDWAVFVANFSDDEFCEIFEKPLKDVGVWKFAQIATKFAVKYLGCPHKKWCEEIDDSLLENLASDIFSGGNFGRKDISRYRHIKYISNHREDKINEGGTFKNLISNAIAMAKMLGFVKKFPFLLPIGLVVVTFRYFMPIIFKKRKMDDKQLKNAALTRRNLYSQFELYK